MYNNSHTQATDAYGNTAAATDQRALEGRILLKAAQRMEELAKAMNAGTEVSRDEIGDVMNYNQKLWQLFLDTMMDPNHALPQEIKNNVGSLAVYVFKRTNEFFLDTKADKLKVLIDINRNIAAGLMKQSANMAAAASAAGGTPPAKTESSGTVHSGMAAMEA